MKALVVFFLAFSLVAEAQIQMPQSSTGSTVTNTVGLTQIKIEYSRPKAKGRKIFGDGSEFTTPYGHIWRTGANNGTLVTFSDDIKFGGADVPKGTYKLFTIPAYTDWTVILTKDLGVNGNDPSDYKKENDVARVMVKSSKLTEMVETFTIDISDLSADSKSANLQLSWENTTVKVPIVVDFDKRVLASIDANTKLNPDALYSAANYYLENGKDLKAALDWVTTATKARPEAYWMLYTQAKIQKALGDSKSAMASSNSSKMYAQKDSNQDYVKMNDDLLKTIK